eukprot:gene16779-8239_t
MKKGSLINSTSSSVISSSKDGGNTKSTKSGPDGPEFLPRMVNEPDVSLDEMLSLACRQGKLDIVKLLIQSGAKINHRNKSGNTPLLEACSQGHVPVARFLLDNGAEIDAPTETTLDSPLTWACTLGNTEVVHELLRHKASVEHRTKDGCTALMFACLAGHVKVAEMLLDSDAVINVESDSNKDSPLTFACWKGHSEVVDLLLSRGANIEHRTKEGFSPLMFAALGGHTGVATKLLKCKAQVNVPSGSNNDIPLTSACWKGHHDVVELLLAHKSNLEHRTKDGCTPLMLAAREGHLQVARLLLQHGAQVNVPSGSENNIPLTLACWKGHTAVVELLLQHGSDIEHRNKAGCTPLMLASREGHYDTTKILLENNSQVNVASGSNDDTPLTLACWKGHSIVVELLIKYKSNVDHQTKTGCTPLMEATREGHKKDAEILLNHGADVELPDNYGQSPLFMACWKGHYAVAELLLERTANRDCRTKTGITPLFQACRENHVSIVKLLLNYGASVNATFPNSRENPLTLAAEKGHKELVNLLLLRGSNHDCHTKKGCSPLFLACKEGHKEIAEMLYSAGADMESTDCRGNTPIMAAFRSGHVHVVEWLIKHTHHLPSDEICHKILMSVVDCKDKEVLFQKRSKCLALIQEAKKRKELEALKNAQSLVKEIDDEITREEKKKKKQAEKRRDKRRKKKSLREMESNTSTVASSEPLENRVGENGLNDQDDDVNGSEMKLEMNHGEDVIDDLDDEEVKAEKLQPYENREETEQDDIFMEAEDETVLKSRGKTTAGNTTVGNNNLNTQSRVANLELNKGSVSGDNEVFEDSDSPLVNGTVTSESRKERRLRVSSSLPETDLRNEAVDEMTHSHAVVTVKPRRRSASSVSDENQVGEKWSRPKNSASNQGSESSAKGMLFYGKPSTPVHSNGHSVPSSRSSSNTATGNLEFFETDWKEVHKTSKTLIIQMVVPNAYCGRVIGKAGSKINSITDDSGAQITVNKPEPQAPNDRLIIVKGSPQSVERARFLVTEALNSPSIFQNQGRNSITLGGFIDQRSLSSASSTTPPLPTQQQHSVPMGMESPRQSPVVTTPSPRSISSVSNAIICSSGNNVTTNSFASLPNQSHFATSRVSYSKVTSGAWQISPTNKGSNPLIQPQNLPTNTIAVSTQSVSTTVARPTHAVATECPADIAENWDSLRHSGDTSSKGRPVKEGAISKEQNSEQFAFPPAGFLTSDKFGSTNANENTSPRQQVEEEAEFSYFSPWNPTKTDSGLARTIPETSGSLEGEGALQSFSALVKSSLFSRDIPPFPWQKAEVIRQDRSRSWAGRPTQLTTDLASLKINENDGSQSLFGNRSVSTNMLSERHTPGFKSPWGTQIGSGANTANGEEVNDPVFIDKMPWIGDGGDRVSDSLLMSNTDTWEPSSSPTSSLSSSRQELNNILDNDSGVGGSNLWSQTPTSEKDSSSQPARESSFLETALGATPWLNSRGAYSAPSSPALQRSNDNPFLTPNKQNLKSHPSMEELNSRVWGKEYMEQAEENPSWGSSRSSPPTRQGRRFSSGAVVVSNDNTQDSGMSSPHNRNSESSRTSRVEKPNDSPLVASSVWRQERFESVASMNDLLSSLALDRYKDLFQENGIGIEKLSNMSEIDLQDLGIAKGPRLKLLRAVCLMTESRSRDEPHKIDNTVSSVIQQQQQLYENIPLEQLVAGQQTQQYSSGFTPQQGPHHLPQMQIPFPPGYEHLPHHRFNFAPQHIRPPHSMIDNASQKPFQTTDYMNQLPHHSQMAPGSQAPAFPVVYQEGPAYFFYQH